MNSMVPISSTTVAAAMAAAPVGGSEALAALQLVKRLYAIRRQRDQVFGATAEVFRDPAWDLMLDLFAARFEGRRTSISSAALVACIPQTTAIRLVDHLVGRGLLRRIPDEHDARRCFLELTPDALDRMWSFLRAITEEDGAADPLMGRRFDTPETGLGFGMG
jgi:hypothetical protein